MKKTTKRNLKFALMLLFWAFVGGIASIVLQFNTVNFQEGSQSLRYFLLDNVTILFLIAILPLIIATVAIQKAKGKAKNAFSLSDDDFESANKFLSLALSISSLMLPWGFVCLGLSIGHNVNALQFSFFWDFLLFIAEMAWIGIIQYRAVEATKLIFPEKRGNILESKFQKEWYASCDEAEKQTIGEACYRSYKTMNTVYPILFAVLICCSTIFEISLYVYILVGLLWAIQLLSYYIPSYKLEHGKRVKN